MVLSNRRDVIAVLKDGRRDLLQDAYGLFQTQQPMVYQSGNTVKQCWDIEHFASWTQIGMEVHVVRCLDSATVRRQITGQTEQQTANWVWVRTISKEKLPTKAFIDFGHSRWVIENNELNELLAYWHVGHVYKHHPVAIEAFWLLTMLAYNLFHAFIRLNIKHVLRCKHSNIYWARLTAAEIYLDAIHHAPT